MNSNITKSPLLSGNKAGLNRALAGILFCKLMSFDHFFHSNDILRNRIELKKLLIRKQLNSNINDLLISKTQCDFYR